MTLRIKGLQRSRWAAIGAAVAVTLGGGGVFMANAASSAPSSVITIDPVRIIDTRDPVNLGLVGPFISPVSQKFTVVGATVPVGATGVLLNATVVSPSAAGFLSVRPGDASGTAQTSSLNFVAGQTLANSVQVALPTSGANVGQIDITYDALGVAGPSSEVLIDVVGYLMPGSGTTGATGPAGPAGPEGATGPIGPQGVPGAPALTIVDDLAGLWTATNPTVSMTPDGVEFGPYANGGGLTPADGGSVCYSGLNGQPMSAVRSLSYNIRYTSTGDSGGVGVPYLRIRTQGVGMENSSVFSPNTQSPDPDIAEGPFHEWVPTSGSWRHNNDVGSIPDSSFQTLIAEHGTEIITRICITTGFSNGTDLAALLRSVEINGERISFRG